MMMKRDAIDGALLIIIGIMLVVTFMPGCATTTIRHETVTKCDGRQTKVWVRIDETPTPALRCIDAWVAGKAHAAGIALGLATLPIGCAAAIGVNDDGEIWWIAYMTGMPWVLEHEMDHVRGWFHPPGLPYVMECRK